MQTQRERDQGVPGPTGCNSAILQVPQESEDEEARMAVLVLARAADLKYESLVQRQVLVGCE